MSKENKKIAQVPQESSEAVEEKKIVYGKDGRRMHPNSLANTRSQAFQDARIKPGETRNPLGKPKNPEKVFRNELLQLLKEPATPDQRKTKLRDLLDHLLERMKKTECDAIYLRAIEVIENSLDEKSERNQSNFNAIQAQNVVILPQARESQPQDVTSEPVDTRIDTHREPLSDTPET